MTASQLQRMDREIVVLVGPGRDRPPARAFGERADGLHRVLVGILGMHRLALAEVKRTSRDRDALSLQTLKVHLDAVVLRILERAMAESRELEVSAEFAVH